MTEAWKPSWEGNWGDKPVNGLTVYGGVGAIHFQEEELRRSEQLLRQLSQDLNEAAANVNGLNFELMVTNTASLGTRRRALDALDESARSLTWCSEAFQDTASRVDQASLRYIRAEMSAAANLTAERIALNGGLPTLDLTEMLMYSVLEKSNESLALARSFGLLTPAPITVREVGDPESVHVDSSFVWLLGRTQKVNAAEHGTLEIIEVDNGAGRAPTFVVSIPGTQGGGMTATENPFDETGIAEAMVFDSTYMAEAVRTALAEAGAEAGDVVVLGGYSQGGMHAANLAADPELGKLYNVEMVVTAGSPVGNVDLPDGVEAVHLEHQQDVIPGTDGTPNPENNHRVTVDIHTRVATPEGEDAGLGPGHDLENYLDGARRVDESQDRALIGAGGILAGAIGGKSGTRHRFKLTRQIPKPSPKPSPKPVVVPSPSPGPQPVPPSRK